MPKVNYSGLDFQNLYQHWLLSCVELNCLFASHSCRDLSRGELAGLFLLHPGAARLLREFMLMIKVDISVDSSLISVLKKNYSGGVVGHASCMCNVYV